MGILTERVGLDYEATGWVVEFDLFSDVCKLCTVRSDMNLGLGCISFEPSQCDFS